MEQHGIMKRLAAYEALLEMKGSMYWNDLTEGFWVVSTEYGHGEQRFVDDPTAAILELHAKWKAGAADRQRENELGMEAARYCGAA